MGERDLLEYQSPRPRPRRGPLEVAWTAFFYLALMAFLANAVFMAVEIVDMW